MPFRRFLNVGAFLYSRSPDLTAGQLDAARTVIRKTGLNPNSFCIIRNQCFLPSRVGEGIEKSDVLSATDPNKKPTFWFLGQSFFRDTKRVATELADWFEDPAILSDWLYSQQQHMVLEQPLVRSLPSAFFIYFSYFVAQYHLF